MMWLKTGTVQLGKDYNYHLSDSHTFTILRSLYNLVDFFYVQTYEIRIKVSVSCSCKNGKHFSFPHDLRALTILIS